MKPFLAKKIRFEQVKGVGTIEVNLPPNQQVYTFIGENGVGKTKFLECLFTTLLFSSDRLKNSDFWVYTRNIPFTEVSLDHNNIKFIDDGFSNNYNPFRNIENSYPLIYLSAQQRGGIIRSSQAINRIGDKKERLKNYIGYILSSFSDDSERLKSLNMDTNLEEWIIQRAQSANPYQSKEDNRQIELSTLCALLNKIDNRIDPEFLEISGDNRVFIKIEGQKRELSELSSGFSSILKMIQSIIAGYSYFTNEIQIANVRGVVLIDEIESHLHNQWQAKIIPLLKHLFPNTTFFITTHSSLVISQLKHGEAYRLKRRKEDKAVYAELIDYPSQVSFIDLLNDAFDVDLNQLKISRAKEEGQQEAKKALLKLVQQELENLEGNK